MTPAEIQALIALGEKVFETVAAHRALLQQIQARDPAVYDQIAAAHAATGKRLDAAAE